MSGDDAKRSISGAPPAKPTSDDRKQSSDGRKLVIKCADMKDEMQKDAVDIAIAAFENNSVEKDVAEHIKKEFDKKYGPTWHCIVGRNFEKDHRGEVAWWLGLGALAGDPRIKPHSFVDPSALAYLSYPAPVACGYCRLPGRFSRCAQAGPDTTVIKKIKNQ